jgi:hypothetical protein
MPFESGHSIPGGRTKGSTNEKVNKVREAITAITEGGIESFNECMDEVRTTNPAKFLEVYLKLLEYSMPKLRSVDTNIGINEESVGGIKIEVINKNNESRTNNSSI